MHFCDNCSNMYYIRLSGENKEKLTYYCRNCGNENTNLSAKTSLCVSKSDIRVSNNSYKNFINEYTKLDPTLPRITNIDCPNSDCPSNKKVNTEELEEGQTALTLTQKEKEIVYIRYNDNDMKYVYLCCNCDRVWKIDN